MVLVRCGDRNIMAAGDPQLTGAHTDKSVLFRLMAAARCFCPPIRPVALMREQMLYLDEDDAAVTSDPASSCVSRDRRQRKKPPPPPFSVFLLPISRFPIHSPPVCPMLFSAPDRLSPTSRMNQQPNGGQKDRYSPRSSPPFFPHAVFCTRQVLLHFTDESAAGQERKARRSSRFQRKCCSNSRFAAPAGSLYTTTKLPTRRGREFFLLIRPPGFRQALQFPPVRCRQRPHRRCRHPPGVPSRHPPHGR